MSEAPAIQVERFGHVAVVELRRPPNNFIDLAALRAVVAAIDELATADCRAVVLASEGRNFCGGAELGTGPAPDEAVASLPDSVIALVRQPLPLIAAVQGAAVGAGFGLAMLADIRIATEESRLRANFAQLGFHHGWALSSTLPLAAGPQAALDLLMTGRWIGGAEALRHGIVHELVGADELRQRAIDLATEIAASAPLAVAAIRATLRAQLVATIESVVAHEGAEQSKLAGTRDVREGIRAAAARRTPSFEGR